MARNPTRLPTSVSGCACNSAWKKLKAQAMLSQMTPARRAEVLAKLPDRLRSLAVFLSPAVKQQ